MRSLSWELRVATNTGCRVTEKINTVFDYVKVMLITVIYVNRLPFLPYHQAAEQLCRSFTNVNLTLTTTIKSKNKSLVQQ